MKVKHNSAIKKKLIASYYDQLKVNLVFVPIFFTLCTYYFSQFVEIRYILYWYLVCMATMLATSFMPIMIYRKFRRFASMESRLERLENDIAIGHFCCGIATASIIWIGFRYLDAQVIIFSTIWFGLAPAITISFMAGIPKVWFASNISLLLPFAIHAISQWDFNPLLGQLVFVWLIVYFIYLYSLVKRLYAEKLNGLLLQAEIELVNENRNRFLAAASHDLRQPLHALGFFVDAMRKAVTPDDDLLDKVDDTIDSLDDLFVSLMDFSRLDTGNVEVRKTHFYMVDLLRELKHEYSAVSEQKSLLLEVDLSAEDVVTYTDRSLYKRILSNCLSNAIRYTDQGFVKIIMNVVDDSSMKIMISDSGRGISLAEQGSIFEEFYQVHNPERDRRQGLGLGLAIVKRLSKLLNISIDLSSQLDIGTTISIEVLQGDSEQVVKAMPNQVSGCSLVNKVVLLIDDDQDIRDSMHQTLKYWGCQIFCFERGSAALEFLASFAGEIDLIISDYRLRDNQSGLDLALQLLAIKQAPVMIISGDTELAFINEVKQQGFELLLKPVKPASLRLQMIKMLKD